MSIVTTLGIRVRSLNEREHTMVRARRVAQERGVTRLAMTAICRPWRLRLQGGLANLTIELTTLRPKLMDSDNIVVSLKAVRDGVADVLAVDDGAPRLHWVCLQDCRRRIYAVRSE